MCIKDYSKLRGRMKELGFIQKEVAKYAKMTETTYSQKLNGHYPFKQSEIQSISTLLHIPANEIGTYFFTDKV